MHTAVRSPFIAGVTLVGAGAIALSPVVPAPDIHALEVRLAAMSMQPVLENPVAVFAPVFESALDDTRYLINNEINNPAPALTAFLTNQTNYAFALVGGVSEAGVALSNGAFYLPRALTAATEALQNGDPQTALAILQRATLGPITEAADDVTVTVQRIVRNQLQVAQQLAVAVPDAAMGVVRATINSINQIALTSIEAGRAVAKALSTGDPVRVVNAITEGAADVAQVAVDTTIGSPAYQTYSTEKSDVALARTVSIATSINQGRREIAQAITPRRAELAEVKALSGADTATPALAKASAAPDLVKAKPKNPVRAAVKQVRAEVRAVVKQVAKALGLKKPPVKEAAK